MFIVRGTKVFLLRSEERTGSCPMILMLSLRSSERSDIQKGSISYKHFTPDGVKNHVVLQGSESWRNH